MDKSPRQRDSQHIKRVWRLAAKMVLSRSRSTKVQSKIKTDWKKLELEVKDRQVRRAYGKDDWLTDLACRYGRGINKADVRKVLAQAERGLDFEKV